MSLGSQDPGAGVGTEDLSQGSEVFLAILTPHCGQGTLGGSQHLDWAIQLNQDAHLMSRDADEQSPARDKEVQLHPEAL